MFLALMCTSMRIWFEISLTLLRDKRLRIEMRRIKLKSRNFKNMSFFYPYLQPSDSCALCKMAKENSLTSFLLCYGIKYTGGQN